MFPRSGVYAIQFSSDWNQILDVNWVGDVPEECLYFESALSAQSSSQPVWVVQDTLTNAPTEASVVNGNVTQSLFPVASGLDKASPLPSASTQLASGQIVKKVYVSLDGVSQVWLIATILYSQIFVGAAVIILAVFRQARTRNRSVPHLPMKNKP
jgi:hypothetical protein